MINQDFDRPWVRKVLQLEWNLLSSFSLWQIQSSLFDRSKKPHQYQNCADTFRKDKTKKRHDRVRSDGVGMI